MSEVSPYPNFKLVIATPYYEIKGYSPYIISLMSSIRVFQELKIEWDYYEVSGDSYVDRAKNDLVNRFLESDFTHIFMIDSDLSWDTKGFLRILKAGLMGAEIVGGAYPNKNNWSTFGAIPILVDGKPVVREVNGCRLMEMQGIPGGFILYSRKAFERTKPNLNSYVERHINKSFTEYFKCHIQNTEFSPEDDNYKNYIRSVFEKSLENFGECAGPKLDEKFLECFRCNIETNGTRLGEDIYFQQRYREMGGTVWLEPDIWFAHYGVKGWEGNYAEYMKKMDQESTQELIDELKDLKKEI